MAMRHIRQRLPHHCAVASLAMVTDLPYESVVAGLGAVVRETGVNEMYVRQFLWDTGFSLRQLYRRELPKGFKDRVEWPPKPFAGRHIAYVNPHHWVAMDYDGTVLDPNRDNAARLSDYNLYSVIGVFGQPTNDAFRS